MKNVSITIGIAFFLLFVSCKDEVKDKKAIRKASIELFNDFYSNFTEDTAFQITRIKFP